MTFSGTGEYNLNNIKEIEVTSSYLGLDQDVRSCQNEEPFYNCTTRHYLDELLNKCGCLPFNIRLMEKVTKIICHFSYDDFKLSIIGSHLLIK